MNRPVVRLIAPGANAADRHFFPPALQCAPAPELQALARLSTEELVAAYCQLCPQADPQALAGLLAYRPRHFKWAGSDLFLVNNLAGERDVLLLETNSCPSGQKYMPTPTLPLQQTGYGTLIDAVFKPLLATAGEGVLAVLYDKNFIEALGYASAMADLLQEPVYLVAMHRPDSPTMIRSGKEGIDILTPQGWRTVRGAWRYFTQRPWRQLSLRGATPIINPIAACIAGGRNKAAAAHAYAAFNHHHHADGLAIKTPMTVTDVRQEQVPQWVARLGGRAVVKVPYSNAGQGVYTITGAHDLAQFMDQQLAYGRVIVQELIGAPTWSEGISQIGTVANQQGDSYAADLRLMVAATPAGFRPVAAYGRRAHTPLPAVLSGERPSQDFLVTNLSYREQGEWKIDTSRLLILHADNMARLGWRWAELLQGYVQTCFAMIAIDRLAAQLVAMPDRELTATLREFSNDAQFIEELHL